MASIPAVSAFFSIYRFASSPLCFYFLHRSLRKFTLGIEIVSLFSFAFSLYYYSVRKQAQYSYFIVMIIFQDIRNRRDVRRILPRSPSRKAADIGARFVSDILRDGTASLQTACCPDFGHLSPSFFMFCC
jgi:hypothetical protein